MLGYRNAKDRKAVFRGSRTNARCGQLSGANTQLATSLTQTETARNLFVYDFFGEQVSDG